MLREYCDRCEELIGDTDKYSTGISPKAAKNKREPTAPWFVEVKITSTLRNWKLCPLCAREVILEALEPVLGKIHHE